MGVGDRPRPRPCGPGTPLPREVVNRSEPAGSPAKEGDRRRAGGGRRERAGAGRGSARAGPELAEKEKGRGAGGPRRSIRPSRAGAGSGPGVGLQRAAVPGDAAAPARSGLPEGPRGFWVGAAGGRDDADG